MSMTFMPVGLNNSSRNQKSLADKKSHMRRNKFSVVTRRNNRKSIKKKRI
jgi:hypothetical protein